jgi:hypothetical protein
MPRGPRGEKRTADVIGAAVMVAQTAVSGCSESAFGPRVWRVGREGYGALMAARAPPRAHACPEATPLQAAGARCRMLLAVP